MVNKKESSTVKYGVLSIVLATISLAVLPILTGLAAFVLGIIGITKKEGVPAVVGLVLSCILPWIGLMIKLAILFSL